MSNLLEVKHLAVRFGDTTIIRDLNFTLSAGKTLAIVGESGSGKSLTASAIMRLTDAMGAKVSGTISFNGVNLLDLDEKSMRAVRGNEIAMIFQEPMTSLDPVFTIGNQLCEPLMLHEGLSRAQARIKAVELLQKVRLADAKVLLNRYPHQLSGGMRQRVMIAMALACRPKLLIADEPTTALDVTIQAEVLQLIKELQQELEMSVIFITHDMGVVAQVADEVLVMQQGDKVEEADVYSLFAHPKKPYTQALLKAVPVLGGMKGQATPKKMNLGNDEDQQEHNSAQYQDKALLSIDKLITRFVTKKNFFGRATHQVHAVEQVSFEIYRGETFSLVGESGSGKSTLARTVGQLQQATGGVISFNGKKYSEMTACEHQQLRQQIHYIFQDPYSALNPRQTVGHSIAEPIITHKLLPSAPQINKRVDELLVRVGLDANHANRFPHEFSGGQRQRICIARALASNPDLIIADEVLSALDVSIQAEIINLFMDLQRDLGVAYLFISHDLAVVEQMSHRIGVLYLGQLVEYGTRAQIMENPQHPYTQRLLAAVPVADPRAKHQYVSISQDALVSPVRSVDEPPKIVQYQEVEAGHFVAIDEH